MSVRRTPSLQPLSHPYRDCFDIRTLATNTQTSGPNAPDIQGTGTSALVKILSEYTRASMLRLYVYGHRPDRHCLKQAEGRLASDVYLVVANLQPNETRSLVSVSCQTARKLPLQLLLSLWLLPKFYIVHLTHQFNDDEFLALSEIYNFVLPGEVCQKPCQRFLS